MPLLMSPDLLSLSSRSPRLLAPPTSCPVMSPQRRVDGPSGSRAAGAARRVAETRVETGNVLQRLGLIRRSQDSGIQQNSSRLWSATTIPLGRDFTAEK